MADRAEVVREFLRGVETALARVREALLQVFRRALGASVIGLVYARAAWAERPRPITLFVMAMWALLASLLGYAVARLL